MAIAASGPIKWSELRAEFGGGSGSLKLSQLYRGGPRIRANAANNPSTNLAASVPTAGAIKLSNFRGAARGFRYFVNWEVANYAMSSLFGDDWNVDYPKIAEFGTSAVFYATSTSYYAFLVSGGAGDKTLINRGHILGAGGQSSGAGGQIALRIDSPNFDLYNYGVIGGGGGAGGVGGVGGTGGTGFYDTAYTAWEPSSTGAYYQVEVHMLRAQRSGSQSTDYTWRYEWFWGGYLGGSSSYNAGSFPNPPASATFGGITYYNAGMVSGGGGSPSAGYQIRRSYPSSYRTYTSGGGGGAGGAGGRGASYGAPNLGGAGGAGGAAGGANAGRGGTGGTGGTGGFYGTAGNTGNTGATGNSGNYAGGSAGGGGGGGGPAGYAIYHTSYAYQRFVTGTLHGPITG